MYITQKRILNVDTVLHEFSYGDTIRIILNNVDGFSDTLKAIGFNELETGNSVLPKIVGTTSRYNALGKYKLLRDEPKEEYEIERDLTFLAYGKHEMTKSVIFTYKRFQRQLIYAPSQEITIMLDKDDNKIVSSDLIIYDEKNKPLIKHIVNLFLELFGECQLVDKDLISRVKTPIKKLHWNILPKGKRPWEEIKKFLEARTNISSAKNSKEIYARINYINSFSPDFFGIGNGGFNDYFVLGFEEKSLYVLENRHPKNATYIFDRDWEDITKLTKAEILVESYQIDRLIHNSSWKNRIQKYLQ